MKEKLTLEAQEEAQKAELRKFNIDSRAWLDAGSQPESEEDQQRLDITKHELGDFSQLKNQAEIKKNPERVAFLLAQLNGGDTETHDLKKRMREKLFPYEQAFRDGRDVISTSLGSEVSFLDDFKKLAALLDAGKSVEANQSARDLSYGLSSKITTYMESVVQKELQGVDTGGARKRIINAERLLARIDGLVDRLTREEEAEKTELAAQEKQLTPEHQQISNEKDKFDLDAAKARAARLFGAPEKAKARPVNTEKTSNEVAEREKQEQELLQELLRDAPAQIHTSLYSEVPGTIGSGLQDVSEKRFGGRRDIPPTPGFYDATGRWEGGNRAVGELLKPFGINEVVEFDLVEDNTYENREVEVAKTGLRGMFGQKEKRIEHVKTGTRPVMHSERVAGGKDERLVELSYRTVDDPNNPKYQDYTSRYGQGLTVKMRLPESLARKTLELMKSNPAFVRKMVEQAALKQTGIPEDTWTTGARNAGKPIRPPYEAWAAAHEGISKVYIRGTMDNPDDDHKIHQENIFSIN